MKFKFTATKSSGEKYDGTREAPDKYSLYDSLKKEGNSVLSFEEVKEKKWIAFFKKFNISFSRVSSRDKILLARNLGSMIDAGLPLSRALSVMEKQTKNQGLKKILTSLNDNIAKGLSLSASMAKHPNVFSSLFVSMIKAGEESGKLAESLRLVANQSEKNYLLLKKVKSAMIYPIVILCVLIAIGVLMLIYVVPSLTQTFKDLNVELPASTQFIILISNLLKDHTLITAFSVLVAGFLIYEFFKTKKGKRIGDFIILHFPLISGLVKETNSARTSRTLSSLLSSGVDFLVAIKITEDVLQNSYYKEILKKAEAIVEKGDPISGVFLKNDKLYPVFVGEMVAIGEETGKLSEMLSNVAEFYEGEVEQKTKDMSTIIEPFLMIVIGLVVGFFAISIISPIYSLSSKF